MLHGHQNGSFFTLKLVAKHSCMHCPVTYVARRTYFRKRYATYSTVATPCSTVSPSVAELVASLVVMHVRSPRSPDNSLSARSAASMLG